MSEELRESLADLGPLVDIAIVSYRDMARHESADQATARLASVLLQSKDPETIAVMTAVAVARLAAARP